MRNKRFVLISVFSILMSALLVLSGKTAVSLADQQTEGQDTQQQIDAAKQQISDYTDALSQVQTLLGALSAQEADVKSNITEIDALSTELNTHLYELDGQINDTQTKIDETQKQLLQAQETAKDQYSAMKERIQYMYESGNVSYIDIFLGSGSLAELYNQLVYIQEVSSYDREKLTEYKDTIQTIETAKQSLESDKASLVAQKTEQEASIAALNQVLATKNDELAQLNASIIEAQNQQNYISDELTDENEYIAELEIQLEEEAEAMRLAAIEAAKEIARKAAEQESIAASIAESQSIAESVEASIAESIRASEAEQTLPDMTEGSDSSDSSEISGDGGDISESESQAETTTSGSGSGGTYKETGNFYLHWPLPASHYISSYFGPRPNAPVEGVALFHNGIDIAAPAGTEIVAAADGFVQYAGDGTDAASGAGGNQVWIMHENASFMTTYMHCSVLLVSVGQKVKAGDVIALVGNTGLSAGNHLDFRIVEFTNGTYVDPLSDHVIYAE